MTTTTLPKPALIGMGIAFLISGAALLYLGSLAVSGGTITWTKGA